MWVRDDKNILDKKGGVVKKSSVLKSGVLLGVCVFLVGAIPGCQRMVNFYNNLQYQGGGSLTAKLMCTTNTFQASTGQYSNCQQVANDLCNCDLYLDDEKVGTFSDCLSVSSACSGDSTLLLTLNDSSDIVIRITCVNRCGDSIMDAGYPVDYDFVIDADLIVEEGMFESYVDE